MKHFDEVLQMYDSQDIVTHNKGIELASRYYISDLVYYVREKKGLEYAFDFTRELASHLSYKNEVVNDIC
jgi:hypothetical protein